MHEGDAELAFGTCWRSARAVAASGDMSSLVNLGEITQKHHLFNCSKSAYSWLKLSWAKSCYTPLAQKDVPLYSVTTISIIYIYITANNGCLSGDPAAKAIQDLQNEKFAQNVKTNPAFPPQLKASRIRPKNSNSSRALVATSLLHVGLRSTNTKGSVLVTIRCHKTVQVGQHHLLLSGHS